MFAYTVVDGQTVLSGSKMTLIAGVFSILAVICYLLCFNLVEERLEVPQNNTKLDIGAMIKSIVTNRALLGIIAAAIFLLLGMLGMSGMSPYIFPVYYNSGTAQSLSSLTSNLAVLIVCAPLAAKLASRFGKKEVSVVSCLAGALVFAVCIIVRPASAMGFVVFFTLAYIGLGFFNTLVWAMITDVIDDAEIKNNVREDGTIYAVYSFARKLGQAASSGMIGAFLTLIGYSDAVAANPTAYAEVMEGIFNLACILPAAGLILVALALAFIYPLNKKRVDENVAELARRRG